jgi:hypothetical protein
LGVVEALRKGFSGYSSGGVVGMNIPTPATENRAGGLNVNINNSTNAKVSARRDEGGGLTIDIVKASLIDDMATDGKVTKAGQHYLGWGRQPR